MKHTFRNEQPKVFEILPEGDYLLEVVKADSVISQGAKTRGSDVLELRFRSVEHGAEFDESLIAHPSCDWKIDLFVNCFAFTSNVGDEIDLDPDNCMGRRGWCKVIIETFKGRDGKARQANKIAVFYTDKPKVPRNSPAPASAPSGGGGEAEDWN